MSDEDRLEYTANPEFNEWLDSSADNVVEIAGYYFPPSETLYKMNYEQYVEAYEAYLADDEILLQDIYADFPTPIAFYLYQAQENYDSAHHRLDLLKSAWEALVFFLYGVVVGEARHRRLLLQSTGIDLRDYYSDRLAAKLAIIENILDYCANNGNPLKCAALISVEAVSKLRALNQRRNEFEHSFAATSDEQSHLYQELFPDILSALRTLRDLEKIRLFRFHSIDNGGPLFPRCDIFQGHSLDGAKKPLRLPEADYQLVLPYFTASSIFAHIEDEALFCVAPFLHFIKNLQDTHPRLMVYKKKLAEAKYLYGVIGQSAQVELERTVFQDRDNELRRLVLGAGA